MAGGGFTSSSNETVFEARITGAVILSCIMAATGGLMFGYDIGISGIILMSGFCVWYLRLYLYLCLSLISYT